MYRYISTDVIINLPFGFPINNIISRGEHVIYHAWIPFWFLFFLQHVDSFICGHMVYVVLIRNMNLYHRCVCVFIYVYVYMCVYIRAINPGKWMAVCCSALQHVVVCCRENTSHPLAQRIKVCCSVLQCVAVCCSVLQCVAVRCSEHTSHPLGQVMKVPRHPPPVVCVCVSVCVCVCVCVYVCTHVCVYVCTHIRESCPTYQRVRHTYHGVMAHI